MKLHNAVALVTGAKRIGATVAEELAKRGVHVALSYGHSKAEAEEAAAAARHHGVRAETFQADLKNPDACTSLVETTVRSLGSLDILINMASVYERVLFDKMTLDDWQ